MTDTPEEPAPPLLVTKKKRGRPAGFKGQTRDIDYRCTCCGESAHPENLVAVVVNFETLVKPRRRIKARTIGWLCTPGCLEKDSIFMRRKTRDSPSMKEGRVEEEG